MHFIDVVFGRLFEYGWLLQLTMEVVDILSGDVNLFLVVYYLATQGVKASVAKVGFAFGFGAVEVLEPIPHGLRVFCEIGES